MKEDNCKDELDQEEKEGEVRGRVQDSLVTKGWMSPAPNTSDSIESLHKDHLQDTIRVMPLC